MCSLRKKHKTSSLCMTLIFFFSMSKLINSGFSQLITSGVSQLNISGGSQLINTRVEGV